MENFITLQLLFLSSQEEVERYKVIKWFALNQIRIQEILCNPNYDIS